MSGWSRCRDCGERIHWGTNPRTGRPFPFDDEDNGVPHFDSCEAIPRVVDPATGRRERVTRCRDCREPIFWSTTWSGARRPMDVRDGRPSGWCHWDRCAGPRARHYHERPEETPAADYQTRPAYWLTQLEPHLVTLELTWPCSRADIRSAYRRLALVRHPDHGGEHFAFIALKRAYDEAIGLLNCYFPADEAA